MQGILSGGLEEQVQQLEAQGQALCDPNVWDGQTAADFRANVWPNTRAALDKTVQALDQLRLTVQRVNQNIMTAGGNAG
jgi:uncharacterized protein YukE